VVLIAGRRSFLPRALEEEKLAKFAKKGIILNVSTYPLPTLMPKRTDRKSKTLTFDINFDLVEDSGKSTRVWFYRGFRFPPPLDDGDRVEVIGKFGHVSKDVFYASKIIDPRRERVYTGFRNRRLKSGEIAEGEEASRE
jgi:hypothetical protein